jgi:hypothetical protein
VIDIAPDGTLDPSVGTDRLVDLPHAPARPPDFAQIRWLGCC